MACVTIAGLCNDVTSLRSQRSPWGAWAKKDRDGWRRAYGVCRGLASSGLPDPCVPVAGRPEAFSQ